MRLADNLFHSFSLKSSFLSAVFSLSFMAIGFSAYAQNVPETIRLDLEPAEPGIRSITLNKKYRPIISRDAKGVVIDTQGSDDTLPPCDVKLEITLENSRILHRDANICSGNQLLVDVANDGKPGAAARVVGTSSGVSTNPVSSSSLEAPFSSNTNSQLDNLSSNSSGLEPLDPIHTPVSSPNGSDTNTAALPEPTFEQLVQDSLNNGQGRSQSLLVAPNENRSWNAIPGTQAGAPSLLEHGVPQTDDRDFRADCSAQTGFAKITFLQATSEFYEGLTREVRVYAGDFKARYTAFGSSNANELGLSLPEVNVEMSDPIWETLIRESELSIEIEGMPTYTVSLKGSANPVRLFVATCSLPQQIISDGAVGSSSQEASSDLSCSEAGGIRSIEASQPGQIVFQNSSNEVIDVHWVDYGGGERPYARLEPGQVLDQQTYVSHAWIVRGSTGECKGIYVTKTPYRQVVIQGTPNFGNPAGGQFGQNGSWGAQNGGFDPLPGGGFPADPNQPGFLTQDNLPSAPRDFAGGNVADYLCTAGVDLNVVFTPDMSSATVAEMGYGVVTLQRQGAANTFYYESQGHVLKGQMQNATWGRPGLNDVFCARR